MTDQTVTASITPTQESGAMSLKFLIATVSLISFGIMMTIFALAYTKDIQTLARAPEMIWAFICGQPNEGGATLPLLLTASAMALIGGFASGGIGWWSARRHSA